MITRENLKEVLSSLKPQEKRRVFLTDKEYIVIYLHVFNVGAYATIKTTNDYWRYKNVSRNGNAILEAEEVKRILFDNPQN
jgi:hypothetical protein